jgi:hypothetical protein
MPDIATIAAYQGQERKSACVMQECVFCDCGFIAADKFQERH